MTTSTKTPNFGWLLPSGNQRMPTKNNDYFPHIQNILQSISSKFHSFWIPDHLMDGYSYIPEAIVTLSYLAGKFPDLFLGTLVISQSYRNPALLAKMGATLQNLSQGRLIMGIGAGWKEDEYKSYGYKFPKASIRIDQLSEAVQICKLMWDSNQSEATFKGRYYQIDRAICLPKPQETIPIMIGGGGEQLTLRVVARYADWWNLPGASADVFSHKLSILEDYCKQLNRPPQEIRKTWMGTVSIARTREEAELKMEQFPSRPGDTPFLGTPMEILKQIQGYTKLGMNLFILRFADEPDLSGIQLFLDQVLSKL